MKKKYAFQYRTLVIILMISSLLNACTSYQPITGTSPENLTATLEAGDRIEITRTDGSEVAMVIDEITPEGISGDETFVSFDEISQVQVRRVDEEGVEDAALLVLGVPLLILGAGLLVLLAAGSAGIPGP